MIWSTPTFELHNKKPSSSVAKGKCVPISWCWLLGLLWWRYQAQSFTMYFSILFTLFDSSFIAKICNFLFSPPVATRSERQISFAISSSRFFNSWLSVDFQLFSWYHSMHAYAVQVLIVANVLERWKNSSQKSSQSCLLSARRGKIAFHPHLAKPSYSWILNNPFLYFLNPFFVMPSFQLWPKHF